MTVKELRAQIRAATMDINQRLSEYYEGGKGYKAVDREIKFLKQTTGTSQGKAFLSMNTHRKNKAALQAQLESLKQFQRWDVYTPTAKKAVEKKARASWKTYKRNTGSRMQFRTYKKAVTIMGAIGDKIYQFFGSDQPMEMLEEAFRNGKKPAQIIKAFEQVIKEYNGKQKSTEDYVDRWYDILRMER